MMTFVLTFVATSKTSVLKTSVWRHVKHVKNGGSQGTKKMKTRKVRKKK